MDAERDDETDLVAGDENLRQAHRHGRVWRDLDGNPVEPLTRAELWAFRALVVGLVAALAGAVWVVVSVAP